MATNKPTYDFKSSIFAKNPFYKRLAKAHMSIAEIDSDVIKWEVNNTRGNFKIPCEYLIHFFFKSTVGINEDQSPVYGYKHTAKITLPPKYPIEAPELYMVSNLWHPNIKSEGKYKGRICGNTKGFGMSYDLELLIIRIGEILQYKNYHAVHTPPFPEDVHAANWVTEYAEPNDIVNKDKGIVLDTTPLVGRLDQKTKEQLEAEKAAHQKKVEDEALAQRLAKEAAAPESKPKTGPTSTRPKLQIKTVKKVERKSIQIKKKD